MNCSECTLKEYYCKPGMYTQTKGATPAIVNQAALSNILFTQNNFEKQLIQILKSNKLQDSCYYNCAIAIYNHFKDDREFGDFITSFSKGNCVRYIIDFLYYIYGTPTSYDNKLKKIILKNVTKQNITQKIDLNKKFLKTSKKILTTARIGQGYFKNLLLNYYNNQCVICGLNYKELLRASHSKPWNKSNSKERTDFYNGLLLCTTHDSLYDNGLISFDDNGKILISSNINKDDYNKLNINKNIKITLQRKHLKYIKYHREHIFKQ